MPIGHSPAERLALKLHNRCLRELSQMESAVTFGGQIAGSTVHYAFTEVDKWLEGSYRFGVVQERLHKLGEEKLLVGRGGRERRVREPDEWVHTWTANVIVYPNLDVVVEDAFGKRDNDIVEQLVLSCALRGPD